MPVQVRQKSVLANARVTPTTGQIIRKEAKRLGFKFGSLVSVVITRYAAMLTSDNRRAVRLYERAMAAICDGESLPSVPRVVFMAEADVAQAHDLLAPLDLLDHCNMVVIAASNDGQETMPLPAFVRIVMAELGRD